MSTWASGWQHATLRHAKIPASPFAVDVLTAWSRSTPTEPWTHNPLGMPSKGFGAPRVLGTPYALFPTMAAFRTAFRVLCQSNHGTVLAGILAGGDDLAATWREIHSLKWPANRTETDYPCALLDMVEKAYRDKLQTREARQRTTSGTTHAAPEIHQAMKHQARVLVSTANAFTDGAAAVRHIMKGLN